MADPLAPTASALDPDQLSAAAYASGLTPQQLEAVRQLQRGGQLQRVPTNDPQAAARAAGNFLIESTAEPGRQMFDAWGQYRAGYGTPDAMAGAAANLVQSAWPGLGKGAGVLAAGAHYLPAIFAGVGARTADRAALKLAEQMEANGEVREAIWHATGWFRGTDKKWRVEIPDYGSRLYAAKPGQPSATLLEHQLEHPELYEAYPHLRHSKVGPLEPENPFGGPSGVRGTYESATGDI